MKLKKNYEYIIIGSGFGGAFAAYNLAKAGKEVLIVDRGEWVKRDDSCWDETRLHIKDPLYRGETPFYADQKSGKAEKMWTDDTVGGMSTFYGAVSLRMREDDFLGAPLPDAARRDEQSAWPFAYKDIAAYYDKAEQLLGIAGIAGKDITEPKRATKYLHEPEKELALPSKKIWEASVKLGLHPFYLPMAINFSGKYGKGKCISCSTCDHYLCKIEAKNDLSVTVLPEAVKSGAVLVPDTRAVKINCSGKKAKSVDLVHQSTYERITVRGDNIIIAGGALATPHLLLSSGIDNIIQNYLIGRYLFRHANGLTAGLFPYKTNPDRKLQKQIGISDYYFGAPYPSKDLPAGVWGMIQDISSIGKGVIMENAPKGLKTIAGFVTDYLINLMCMAEDIPQLTNRVYIETGKRDKFGMPSLMVYHRYHKRDLDALRALYKKAKKIIFKAGGLPIGTLGFNTFSHAMGTCRMGVSKSASVVDPECRVWGLTNLYVIDASVMPSGGSVNPSLTIAALSLRASGMLGA
ncbi:MAG: GMC family oxidoreductase [Spirochaetes bacterium]|nr:GMC family oxidoreductase [Spirochaetota bacterium]